MESCTPWMLDVTNAIMNGITTIAVSYISYKYGRSQNGTSQR